VRKSLKLDHSLSDIAMPQEASTRCLERDPIRFPFRMNEELAWFRLASGRAKWASQFAKVWNSLLNCLFPRQAFIPDSLSRISRLCSAWQSTLEIRAGALSGRTHTPRDASADRALGNRVRPASGSGAVAPPIRWRASPFLKTSRVVAPFGSSSIQKDRKGTNLKSCRF